MEKQERKDGPEVFFEARKNFLRPDLQDGYEPKEAKRPEGWPDTRYTGNAGAEPDPAAVVKEPRKRLPVVCPFCGGIHTPLLIRETLDEMKEKKATTKEQDAEYRATLKELVREILDELKTEAKPADDCPDDYRAPAGRLIKEFVEEEMKNAEERARLDANRAIWGKGPAEIALDATRRLRKRQEILSYWKSSMKSRVENITDELFDDIAQGFELCERSLRENE